MRRMKRGGWVRCLGFAVVPLVIAASFLGLLIGIAGLCMGADQMASATPSMGLCVFFCGLIVAPTLLLVVLWIAFGSLFERTHSLPLSIPLPIFHPPTPSAG